MTKAIKLYYKLGDIRRGPNRKPELNFDEIAEFNKLALEELEYAEKCHKLEEQVGLPLDVLVKLLKQKYYYDEKGNKKRVDDIDILCKSIYTTTHTGDGIQFQDGEYFGLYKTTWWLKEDKSE